MSARADLRAAPVQWRAQAATPALDRGDILRAAYRHSPALARLLRITVLRAAARAHAAAVAERNARTGHWHAEEARRLTAVAEILRELAA